jgi:quercetin dioxygenase-like cupin family protein
MTGGLVARHMRLGAFYVTRVAPIPPIRISLERECRGVGSLSRTLQPPHAKACDCLHRRLVEHDDYQGGAMTQNRMWTFASVALVVFAGAAIAQNAGVTRTVIIKADVSVPNREAVETRVEIAPGGVVAWHTHPGDEVSYVTDGELTLMVAGHSARKVAAGEGFVVPAGTVHSVKNEGSSVTKLVTVYIVEKGKPLLSPASAPVQ